MRIREILKGDEVGADGGEHGEHGKRCDDGVHQGEGQQSASVQDGAAAYCSHSRVCKDTI